MNRTIHTTLATFATLLVAAAVPGVSAAFRMTDSEIAAQQTAKPVLSTPRADVTSGGGYGTVGVADIALPAVAVPAAGLLPDVVSGGGYGSVGSADAIVPNAAGTGNSFEWGDAAVGATVAILLMGLAFAGVSTTRRTRAHRTTSA